MGPVRSSGGPNRSRCFWYIRSLPWTDVQGVQQEYAKAVKRWCQSYDNLAHGNRNNISVASLGIVLLSNLYGRAKDLCESTEYMVGEANFVCVASVSYALNKRECLSVVNVVHQEFNLWWLLSGHPVRRISSSRTYSAHSSLSSTPSVHL